MSFVSQFMIALGLLAALIGAFALGRRAGRKRAAEHPQLGIIQGGMLGLLGLVLGFCFSGSMSRFVERQDIIIRESNAIGTVWLRADLLPASSQGEFRRLTAEYADERIALFRASTAAESDAVVRRLSALQRQLWALAIRGIVEFDTPAAPMLDPLNQMFDLLSLRNAAADRHVPMPVIGIVVGCALACVAAVGYGLTGAHQGLRVPAMALIVLICATLWITIDLDYPRLGIIKLNDKPLMDARAAMTLPAP